MTKIYYKRKYTIIASNIMISEDYFVGGTPINILGCYF